MTTKVPESSLLDLVLRVREIAQAAYRWWMAAFILIYVGVLAPPLMILGLIIAGKAAMHGVAMICLGAIVFIALLFLLDPRARLARVEAAFNDLAWTSRIDVVAGPVDAPLTKSVRLRLRQAVRLLDTKDAAALLPVLEDTPPDA